MEGNQNQNTSPVYGAAAAPSPGQPAESSGQAKRDPGRMGEQRPKGVTSPFAAARRQAEAEKNREIAAIKTRQETFAASRGYATFDEMERANQTEQYKAGSVTPEALEPMVNRAVETRLAEHPMLQMARDQICGALVEQSLDEFRRTFPKAGVNTVEDLLRVPNFEEFSHLVGLGLTYVQAYKLANEGELHAQSVAAAKQAALNAFSGKGHLTGTDTYDDDPDTDVVVPADTLRAYRAMMPDWSDAKIRRHYRKSRKED